MKVTHGGDRKEKFNRKPAKLWPGKREQRKTDHPAIVGEGADKIRNKYNKR